MENFNYSVSEAQELAKRNRIDAWIAIIVSAISLFGYIAVLIFIEFKSLIIYIIFPFVAIACVIAFVIALGTLIDCKVYEWEYKGHTISAYNGNKHHVTYVDGIKKEYYGPIWWQHTAAVRIDDDQVCVKFGPVGVHFYVKANIYKPSVE